MMYHFVYSLNWPDPLSLLLDVLSRPSIQNSLYLPKKLWINQTSIFYPVRNNAPLLCSGVRFYKKFRRGLMPRWNF
jgi:hypothetical protein